MLAGFWHNALKAQESAKKHPENIYFCSMSEDVEMEGMSVFSRHPNRKENMADQREILNKQKEVYERLKEVYISGHQVDGPGLFAHLITFLSVLLIFATLPLSLIFAVKVVQVCARSTTSVHKSRCRTG